MYHSTSSSLTYVYRARIIGTEARNSEIGSSASTRNPMADWQMREKAATPRTSGRASGASGQKNYITPAGLQRLKDEHCSY